MNNITEQSLDKEYKLFLENAKKLPGEKRDRSENKNNISHRAIAFAKMRNIVEKIANNL